MTLSRPEPTLTGGDFQCHHCRLLAGSCLKGLARSGRKLRFACSWLESTVSGSVWRLISAKSKRSKHL